MKDEWKLIGHCGVDAGLIMIGDPCYVTGDNPANALIKDWDKFCDAYSNPANNIESQTAFSIPFARGHDGAGVVMSSGIGDGYYPVYARFKELEDWGTRIVEARIVFIGEET